MTAIYPTASTIAVFLNGYHVEQGYQLQYKESLSKTPIYGYNDTKFSKVAYGRQMVQGILVVNFLFAGYLNTILDTLYNGRGNAYVPKLYNYSFGKKGEDLKDKLITDIQGQLRTELPTMATAEDRSARASYIASLLEKNENMEVVKKALENEFLTTPEGLKHLLSPIEIQNEGATLDIYYQDPSFSSWFVRFENVHFYEVSQANSQAGAEGSSDPLYEIYSFIASNKIIKLINK